MDKRIDFKGGCNKGVPVEQNIHYIVKDYRRMYCENGRLLEAVKALRDRLQWDERKVAQCNKDIEGLKDRLVSAQEENARLKSRLDRKPHGCSVELYGWSDDGCSLLFFGKGGSCCEQRLSHAEIRSLYAKIAKYMQGQNDNPPL